ncbi:MAG: inorganic phosphate transporter [Clostridiaceae bacterium]|nr:inorganic phosphate transporter [Clostridiaceae bacterium]
MFALYIVLLLVCASVFVNGWTDAPNAIATVISTRVLSPKAAIILAAIFNLLGVFMMGTAVANTTANIVTIGTGRDALITLAAAQLSIVIWAVSAWRFGIPTSESHALIAGLMGAGISFKGIEAFNWEEFKLVLIGLGVASILGFIAGFFTTKVIALLFRRANRRKSNTFFSWGQIASAALMAFNHGAQDGQKFMGVFALALTVGGIFPFSDNLIIPAWVKLLIAALMAVGTSIGGLRIIKTMGMDMVKLEKYQGFAAEIGASACMMGATFFGIPLSTTNAKGTAIMGAGAARRFSDVNWGIVKEMLIAWILTFPGCLALGYVMAKLFNFIF